MTFFKIHTMCISICVNGTTQSYNKKQFDCNNAADKKLIKQFEMQLINGLKSQG